eukprot:2911940-Karenia_brevis.AAC.1
MKKILETKFEISTNRIGPGEKDAKQAKLFNRTITYTASGIQYEADPRHAELIIKQWGLSDCKEVITPGILDEP